MRWVRGMQRNDCLLSNCGGTNYDVMYAINHNWVAAINVVSVSIFLLGS